MSILGPKIFIDYLIEQTYTQLRISVLVQKDYVMNVVLEQENRIVSID